MIEILYCPICGEELQRHEWGWDELRPLTVEAREDELICRAHFEAEHPVRYWLWRHLRWDWLVGWSL